MLNMTDNTFAAGAVTGATRLVPDGTIWSAQLTVAGTGAVSAAAIVEVTNTPDDANSWVTLFTLSASGTTAARDSAVAQAAWRAYRVRSTAISGTGAAANVAVCVGG